MVAWLPQRLKSTFFQIFSSFRVPFRNPPSTQKNWKNPLISVFEANSSLAAEMDYFPCYSSLWCIVKNTQLFVYIDILHFRCSYNEKSIQHRCLIFDFYENWSGNWINFEIFQRQRFCSWPMDNCSIRETLLYTFNYFDGCPSIEQIMSLPNINAPTNITTTKQT